MKAPQNTREAGTYVVLDYDGALRLTNEVYYTSGGTATGTNGYAYDASGTRTILYSGGVTLTNDVDGGYQVTEVKNGSTTVETYGYDDGGRVTSINRTGLNSSITYNSADQLTSVAGQSYVFDGAGRRVKATGGTERRFLVAETPGTEFESPHLIADSGNSLKQGYVFVGDEPLVRYDGSTGTSRVYYLEDGMRSVIGLTPQTSPGTGNTSRIFYDGFGNVRTTFGPTPTNPTGTGGDFRFHGLWLEDASGLYHVRARDYDPVTGRFLSRDPFNGSIQTPEAVWPYTFSNDSPMVYSDPSGLFSLIELNTVSAKQASLQAGRGAATNAGKQKFRRTVTRIITSEVENQVRRILPDFPIPDLAKSAGNKFHRIVRDAFCDFLKVPDNLYFEVGVTRNGTPIDTGLNCSRKDERPYSLRRPLNQVYPKGSVFRPDLIIGPKPPRSSKGGIPKSWAVVEFKGTTGILFREYAQRHPRNPGQLEASLAYAGKHTYSRTFLMIVATHEKGVKMNLLKKEIGEKALARAVVPLLVVVIK